MANAEREKLSRKHEKSKKSIAKKKIFIPHSCDSWYVYNRIVPLHIIVFLWVYVVLTLGIIAFGMYYTESNDVRLWYAGAILCSAFGLRLIIHWIIKLIQFTTYKNWRKNLQFTLVGWEKLGSESNFPKKYHWYDEVVVEVKLKNLSSSLNESLVKDALFLFTCNANKNFHSANQVQSGFMGDIRKTWSMGDGTIAKGSADGTVMGQLYVFLHKHLSAVQKEKNCIDKVEINYHGKIHKIEPPDSDVS